MRLFLSPAFGARRPHILGDTPRRQRHTGPGLRRPRASRALEAGEARRGGVDLGRIVMASGFASLATFYGATAVMASRQGGLVSAVAASENALGFGVAFLGLGLSLFGFPKSGGPRPRV